MARDRSDGGGYICVWRSWMEHKLYFTQENRAATIQEAFLDIILRAAYEDQNASYGWSRIQLKRGDLLTSVAALALRFRWSRGKVRRFLADFREHGEIDLKTDSNPNSRWTILTVCNYAKWQDVRPANVQVNGHQTDSKRTSSGHIQPSEPSEPINQSERNGPEQEQEPYRRFEDFPSNGNGHPEPLPPGTYGNHVSLLRKMSAIVQGHWSVNWLAPDTLTHEVASLVRAGAKPDRILEVWTHYVRTMHDPAKISLHWFVANYNQHQAKEARDG